MGDEVSGKDVRAAPTGRCPLMVARSQDCAALVLGYFRSVPTGLRTNHFLPLHPALKRGLTNTAPAARVIGDDAGSGDGGRADISADWG